MKKEKTLLVITPESSVHQDSAFYLLVARTGECLASHICSHSGFAKSDLYSGRPERIKEFTERFGECEVKFIDETEIDEKDLLALNKKWYESLPKEEAKL